MKSKLLVNVQENGSPCITVIQPYGHTGGDFVLADKVLQMFFEKMDLDASFCGVVTVHDSDGERVRSIIPMDIPHVLEWLSRYFVEVKCRTESETDEVLLAFEVLRRSYFNERGCEGSNS